MFHMIQSNQQLFLIKNDFLIFHYVVKMYICIFVYISMREYGMSARLKQCGFSVRS